MLAATHELDDGSRVRLRLARPSDAIRINAFLEDVDAEVETYDLTFYDPRERVTVAATEPGGSGEDIVGLAEVDIASAAVAVLTRDDETERGLDDLLVEAGSELAQRRAA